MLIRSNNLVKELFKRNSMCFVFVVDLSCRHVLQWILER